MLHTLGERVQGGLRLKRGFSQGCALNVFSTLSHSGNRHEQRLFSFGAVLGNSIASLEAIGFVVHFSAYICVAVWLIETKRPCCFHTVDGPAFRKPLQIGLLHLLSPFSFPAITFFEVGFVLQRYGFVSYDVISRAFVGNLTPVELQSGQG